MAIVNQIRHWIFNVIAIASTLVCFGTALLWARSSYYGWGWEDVTSARVGQIGYSLDSDHGQLRLVMMLYDFRVRPDWHHEAYWKTYKSARHPTPNRSLHFAWDDYNFCLSITKNQCEVGLPHWLLILICGVLPLYSLYTLTRSRLRFDFGHCATCGYDLRATSDRCPECGTPVSKRWIFATSQYNQISWH